MTIKNLLVALFFSLFAISSAILFTLLFKPLFLWQLGSIDTKQVINLDIDTVSYNYDVLLTYLVNPFVDVLHMPNIKSSSQGLFHFKEVKQLFLFNNVMFIISLFVNIKSFIYIQKTKQFVLFAKVGKILSLVPICIVFVLSISFKYWFVLFHKLFFNNDAWLFDETLDPIITILPESFFMWCFILMFCIVELWFLGAWLYYRSKTKLVLSKMY